ncbi:MAG: selenide, water dikinase SelD, partial [Pseudohongiellaceae bacterium]
MSFHSGNPADKVDWALSRKFEIMKKETFSPHVKRLILVGGGHSHLAVLKRLAMRPVPGLETILVTREVLTPYSGALPACISGVYQHDDMHIDLRPLANFAGARLLQLEVSRIDLSRRLLLLQDRPPLQFDLLSLNIGSRPDATSIPGAEEFATGIKPIDHFLEVWETVRQSAVQRLQSGGNYCIAIVGGGPASVELAFAAQHRITRDARSGSPSSATLKIKLITSDGEILPTHNERVRRFTKAELIHRGIELLNEKTVTGFRRNSVICAGNETFEADTIFYATGASVPTWPADIGLQVDEKGFILVNTCLQSISHAFVFVSGDAATIENHPRPKSGVYAVRQGKPLAENLVRYATGHRLVKYVPQRHALALIYTGDRKAIASRDNLFFHGRWVWQWKNRIDRSFLNKYRELPEPEGSVVLAAGITDRKSEQALRAHAIRCSGCGAKVGGSLLKEVLGNLEITTFPDVVAAVGSIEDAAQILVARDKTLIQSVDYLPAFTNDPWLFARIATLHCLGDIHAMGAEPHSAQAIAGIPFAGDRFMRETLKELMHGCVEILNQEDTALIGGHTLESRQMSFGLSVNGFGRPGTLLSKSGVKAGDILILCKPLGTGTLLAADMRLRAKGSWMAAAFDSMLISNRAAARILLSHHVNACTDVTGFGLAGHLMEMISPTNTQVEISIESLPFLDGALDCLAMGIHSSLQADNRLVEPAIFNTESFLKNPLFKLLFDPQTAGGLLASVPAGNADSCLATLSQTGYPGARKIGNVIATGQKQATI